MRKRMNNRGQFFILAAVIIAVVLVGIATTRNYISAKEEPKRFFDLSDEIKMEGGKVIDFGIINAEKSGEEEIVLESFLLDVEENFYANYPDDEFIFVYGDNSKVNVINMAKENLESGGVNIAGGRVLLRSTISESLGSTTTTIFVKTPLRIIYPGAKWKKDFTGKNEMTITFNNQEYNFKLGDNQRFYLIMRREADNEVYVDEK